MKNKFIHLLTEFVMVFLGVLLAFVTSNWAERNRDKKYISAIIDNLVQDVQNDSIRVIQAIETLKMQHDSLNVLINHLGRMNFKRANPHIYWTYFSYNVFDPTTQTFQSMVSSGDMKLIDARYH